MKDSFAKRKESGLRLRTNSSLKSTTLIGNWRIAKTDWHKSSTNLTNFQANWPKQPSLAKTSNINWSYCKSNQPSPSTNWLIRTNRKFAHISIRLKSWRNQSNNFSKSRTFSTRKMNNWRIESARKTKKEKSATSWCAMSSGKSQKYKTPSKGSSEFTWTKHMIRYEP